MEKLETTEILFSLLKEMEAVENRFLFAPILFI